MFINDTSSSLVFKRSFTKLDSKVKHNRISKVNESITDLEKSIVLGFYDRSNKNHVKNRKSGKSWKGYRYQSYD